MQIKYFHKYDRLLVSAVLSMFLPQIVSQMVWLKGTTFKSAQWTQAICACGQENLAFLANIVDSSVGSLVFSLGNR